MPDDQITEQTSIPPEPAGGPQTVSPEAAAVASMTAGSVTESATAIADPNAFSPPVVSFRESLRLPGAVRKPTADIGRSMVWLYGEPKIGKTTFASEFPGTWFIATEKGQDWVEIREPTLVNCWDDFIEWCLFMANNQPTKFADGTPIRTIAIDTIDGLFRMCLEHICRSLGVDDPGELPHGKGWAQVNTEFDRVMNKVRRWPFGMVCISHVRSKEFKARGRKTDRQEPYIGAAGARWAQSAADLILYAHTQEVATKDANGNPIGVEEQRVLLTHPQSWAVAGGRMLRSMNIPPIIPLDYKTFIKYFPGTPTDAVR